MKYTEKEKELDRENASLRAELAEIENRVEKRRVAREFVENATTEQLQGLLAHLVKNGKI